MYARIIATFVGDMGKKEEGKRSRHYKFMSKLRQVKTSLRSNIEVKLKKKNIQRRMKQRRALKREDKPIIQPADAELLLRRIAAVKSEAALPRSNR